MIKVGIVGMGGFAAAHQLNMLKLESNAECKLKCSCDPELEKYQTAMQDWGYKQRGVSVYNSYVEMLNAEKSDLDMLIIPTPIYLHAEMHKLAVESGIPVYLEKPPTLNYIELEKMLQVEKRASKLTNVGFNFTIEKTRREIKSRILKNEFGALLRVELFGNWPRPNSYYKRNNWAGKLVLGESLILDSIMGNAMAHYVHNVLLWSGLNDLFDWGEVKSVSAELYRANDIQGADTVFVEAIVGSNSNVRIALSHACNGAARQYEKIVLERAIIEYVVNGDYTIRNIDGGVEHEKTDRGDLLYENVKHYIRYLSGTECRPMNLLCDSKPFVHLNDLAYISSQQITTIPENFVKKEFLGDDGYTSAVHNIASICDSFLKYGTFPREQGVEWGSSGKVAVMSDLPKLQETIIAMI